MFGKSENLSRVTHFLSFATLIRYLLIGLLAVAVACSKSPELQPLTPDAVMMAFGDSLTYGTGAARGSSYPDRLATLLERQVINAGVPGETSATGLSRLSAVLAEHQPDLVILCHGGNDILRNHPMKDLERNLAAMVDVVRTHGAQVVMLGIPGRNFVLDAPAAYRNVAESRDVPLDDETLPALMSKPKLKSDRVHFNAEGYSRIAQATYELIERAGGLSP